MKEEIIHKLTVYRSSYMGDTKIIDLHNEHLLSFDKGRVISNVGGYQSNNITFGYVDLINHIIEEFSKINLKVRLSNFWLNINKGTDFNVTHTHGLDHKLMSVVYYHKLCCDKCPIVFTDVVPSIYNWKHIIIPQNQEILFFSGLYPHETIPCQNPDHQRISIAFNFDIL